MHGMHSMLVKLGIPTYSDTYYTQLTGATPTKIGQTMPSVIGLIYGLSVDVGSTQPLNANLPCILAQDTYNLWLQLKVGSSLYVDNYRLDRLVYNDNNNVAARNEFVNPMRYFPVVVPSETDLKESTYYNPTGLGNSTPVYVPLTVHYLDKESYKYLQQKGYVYPNAKSAPNTPHAVKQ